MGIAKVILLEPIRNLGNVGDIVSVKKGFFRNYLFPQKKALQATRVNIEKLEEEEKVWMLLDQQRKEKAEKIAEQFEDFSLELKREAAENNQLYGSVSSQDIYKILQKEGFEIRKQDVRLNAPIKSLGKYKVVLDLHPEISVELTVNVNRELGEHGYIEEDKKS